MNETIAGYSNPLKTKKALTFFIVPFHYEGEWEAIHAHISRWQPAKEPLYSEDILYSYIMDFFKNNGQGEDGASKTANSLQVYALETKDKGVKSEFFFDRILGKQNVAVIESDAVNSSLPSCVPFVLSNKDNGSPHLFISPSAKIGLMTFCLEFTEGASTEDLLNFNYALHKRNECKTFVTGEKEKPNGEKVKLTEKRTINYRCLCPLPEANGNFSDNAIKEEVTQYLSKEGFGNLVSERNSNNTNHVNWDLNFFVDFLLNNLGRKETVKYFNRERTHVFTFCSVDDTSSAGGIVSKEKMYSTLIQLSRVVNYKYLLPFDKMMKDDAILQTYENFLFSSALEGTSMMCIAKDANKEFVSEMQHKFIRQYLLIYLLVLFQRYTLLDIDRKLVEFQLVANDDHADEEQNDSDQELWNLIDIICKTKVNCYYTDVSVYTHHTQFYQHCCRSLHVPESFKEIDEKVELLKLITNRRMQQLMERQQNLQKEAARNHQEEIERLRENEARLEKQHSKELEEAERRQHVLNLVVALLTIAQVMQASYELINSGEDKTALIWSLLIGVFILVLLVLLMKKDILQFFKKR